MRPHARISDVLLGMERVVLGLLGLIVLVAPLRAETAAYDEPPIRYSEAQPHDPVARLKERMDKGEVRLDYSSQRGYLKSLLRELKIPISSQTLVFSKTSFQRKHISPQNPRALYFDDDTYVGYVPGGDVVEIATTDPALGTIFYTLDQRPPESAAGALVRQTDNCLECHGGSMTRDIPGLLVRSTYPDSHGQPILSAGTFLTTQESPLKERWGGWYVTGLPADGGHLGNALFSEQEGPEAKPAGTAEWKGMAAYLSPRSDPVGLLVLAHQVEAHNR